ncbi:hypothetical protein [Inquilinus sp. Marseille-Q2685]|uniref:hypothetical protein n=1 Tax=Inquilinus sp. Marseille-Q2685 TaxID=2866581 RepID=UPI001CE42FBD|nr:hypothetical protein [Inquilinus sp. Marseille-Q2685]
MPGEETTPLFQDLVHPIRPPGPAFQLLDERFDVIGKGAVPVEIAVQLEGQDFRFGERIALSMSHEKSPDVIIPQ